MPGTCFSARLDSIRLRRLWRDSLLFATTYLWHVPNIQENNQQFLFTIAAFLSVLKWSRTDQPKWLTLAGVFVGFNLLIRLTTMADVAGVVIFASLLSNNRKRFVRPLAFRFAPPIVCYLVLDRIYHWIRFGSFSGTYMGLLGQQMRLLNPGLPPSFPFNGAFADGFLGVFFRRAKSIFIYDPLLLLTLALVVYQWRRLTPICRAYIVAILS